MNIIGNEMNAYLYWMMGMPLWDFVIWLMQLPKVAPNIDVNTMMFASLGRQLKNVINTTNDGPPPPNPAKLDNPVIMGINIDPINVDKDMGNR